MALRFKHKCFWCGGALFLLGVILLVHGFYSSKYRLCVSYYTVDNSKLSGSIRIVQLSDLHNRVFGAHNQDLVDTVEKQHPDLILITGDLVNSSTENTKTAVELIAQLCEIAPVYLSLGNHELEHQAVYGTNMTLLYEEAGADVLEYSYMDLTIRGTAIRLGGLYGYCLPEKYLETNEAAPEECAFLNEFQNTEAYTILLCHMPVCWIANNGINEWDIDCVFAGHSHGGQIRLPLIGGLWAPDQGWLPGREAGLYYSDDQKKGMVLSRGLGSAEKIPRFNNTPEVVVVDLRPQQ